MTHTLEFTNESMDEHMERWAEIRRRRKAEGKCWQCAKPIADCTCPNVKHQKPNSTHDGRGTRTVDGVVGKGLFFSASNQ